jgi:hypothetical protein
MISELEGKLLIIEENELSFITDKNAAFENINTERITPFFLKVIRGNKDLSSQNSIKTKMAFHFLMMRKEKNISVNILLKSTPKIRMNRTISLAVLRLS